jgi:hypothetical protein
MITSASSSKDLLRVTPADVRIFAELLPPSITDSTTGRSYKLAQAVLRQFLGLEWVQKYIWTANAGFIRCDMSTPLARETYYMRTVILAEMLYNLQVVDGFDSCLVELRAGQIESAYAALEIARMLCTVTIDKGMTFRFIKPRRRRSYDLEMTFSDGVKVCGETKCKLEETDITLNTIKRSLEQAQKQLPKRRPGVIFVKIPRRWLNDVEFATDLKTLTARFFGTTKRVVSVKYYTSTVTCDQLPFGERIGERMGYLEHSNTNHRFRKLRGRDWNIFLDEPPQAPWAVMSYNGMPLTWQRLFFTQ